jgi:hypothetical protein
VNKKQFRWCSDDARQVQLNNSFEFLSAGERHFLMMMSSTWRFPRRDSNSRLVASYYHKTNAQPHDHLNCLIKREKNEAHKQLARAIEMSGFEKEMRMCDNIVNV